MPEPGADAAVSGYSRAMRPVETLDLVPTLRAIPAMAPGAAGGVQLLTPAQRRKIATIATQLPVTPRSIIFRADEHAEHVFINGGGVVKTVQDLANGRRRVIAFWFARDVFGLAENGRYMYTTMAVTPVMLYRIPVDALQKLLLEDAQLQLQVLCKITHELRESQRHTLVLIRKDAIGRVAMFLKMLERETRAPGDVIAVPMSRSDIANYLGLTLEAVSRATRKLHAMGIVTLPERHVARILDRARFEQLVARL
jgi:CRP-like cAMP-binding protein